LKKENVAITAVVLVALGMWWHASQPDPPDVRFLASVHAWSPETRTMSDMDLLNHGYAVCGTLKIKGLDGVNAEADQALATGVTYANSVRESALDNLCPFTNP
jgi:hypothetical protein